MIDTVTAWTANLPAPGVLWEVLAPLWLGLGVVQSGWVIMQRRSPASTVGWIVALMAMPIVGLVIYRFFGPLRVNRQRLKRLHGRARLGTQQEQLALREEYPDAPHWAVQHTRLIERASGIPMSTAHAVVLLQDGVATLASMLDAVRAARHHVHLEYYIYEPDQIGERLRDALIERLQAGVEVRLLVDAVGSPKLNSRAGRRFLANFTRLGGEFAVFHPNRFDRLRPLVNLRTHRKILIVDGVVGFTGGINITEDENEEVRETAFRDTHIRLEGPVVRWLQYVFLEDWAYAGGSKVQRALSRELIVASEPGPIGVQVIASGPDTRGEAIHRRTSCRPSPRCTRWWMRQCAASTSSCWYRGRPIRASSPPPHARTSRNCRKPASRSSNTCRACCTRRRCWWTTCMHRSAPRTSTTAASASTSRWRWRCSARS
jgi:cardiolipin synthase